MENYQDQENQDLAPKGLIGAIQRESSGFNASKHVAAAVELNIHHSSTLVLKLSHLKITFPPENTKWLYNYLYQRCDDSPWYRDECVYFKFRNI